MQTWCMDILCFIASAHNIIGLLIETVHDSNAPRWIMDMDVDRQESMFSSLEDWT